VQGAEPGDARACDLYDYDAEDRTLTDLTTDANPADTQGAALQGVIGVSRNGSYVYFAAKGQLLPGSGRTFAENVAQGGSANIYLAHAGQLKYVTNLTDIDVKESLVREPLNLTARVDSSGTHLLFESRSNIVGYENSGASEAYIYSADSNQISCVSCRSDERPPKVRPFTADRRLPRMTGAFGVSLHYGRSINADGSRVFFSSEDALAPGAIEGHENVYQWENGTVRLLVSEGQFWDSSASGDDVFLATPQQLDPHDVDHEMDLYDLRVDGGFPPPPPPPTPCDPIAGQCQGPESPAPGAPDVSSQGFTGPGNPKPKPPKKHKKHHDKKKHHKKRHKKQNPKKHHDKTTKPNDASRSRGVGQAGNDNPGGSK
jgi:hypothetical protein